ncbi:MAG: hypothetical protein Ta2B_12010 [Termitinemataceae bacterium]|nr:MAG: hypothetical protein Ta2B_12010 [Termitinemataceae bacterium]
MKKISPEAEVDAIRDKIYAEIKDMSPEEQTDFINARARVVCKEFGIRLYNDEELMSLDMVYANK